MTMATHVVTSNAILGDTACIIIDKQESEKVHFNPVGLVRSLRDWEGQPLDVMVQQDASEFITQFFQQVL